MRVLFIILRTTWTLPTTMVGVVIAALCTPLGTRWRMRKGVIECHSGLVAWLLKHATLLKGGATAITFGDSILGRTPLDLDDVRAHEHVHVRQSHRWGPFFIPAYLMASVIAVCKGRPAYMGNAFEIEAYAISDPSKEDRPLRFDGDENGPYG